MLFCRCSTLLQAQYSKACAYCLWSRTSSIPFLANCLPSSPCLPAQLNDHSKSMRAVLFIVAAGAICCAGQVADLSCSASFEDLDLTLAGHEAVVRCPQACAAAEADELVGCGPVYSEGPVCSGAALQLFGSSYSRLRRSFTVRKVDATGSIDGCVAHGVYSAEDTSPAQAYEIVSVDRGEILRYDIMQ